MRGFIGKGDYRVMQRANNWAAPHWVRVSAMAATRAGDGWLWCLVGLLVLLLGDQDRVAAVGAAGRRATPTSRGSDPLAVPDSPIPRRGVPSR